MTSRPAHPYSLDDDGLDFCSRVSASVRLSVYRGESSILTGRLDDGLELGDQGGVDEGGEVEAADGGAEQAEVEGAELEGGEVEVAEDAEAGELAQQGDLLQLQQGVDVERVLHEDVLEAAQVQVVERGQLHERLQVEPVDGVEVLQVLVGERELVEGAQVDREPLRGGGRRGRGGGSGRGRGGEGREGADDDADGLHLDGCSFFWNVKKDRGRGILKILNRAQLETITLVSILSGWLGLGRPAAPI